MAKNPVENKNFGAYVAVVLVLFVAVFVATSNNTPPNQNAIATPTVLPSVQPSVTPACKSGEQKEFSCVGSISGTQTYYECVNSTWVSQSRYNYSECVKTFGPNETVSEGTQPDANATITPAPEAAGPGFTNLTVNQIRATTAELYWFTNANATGTVTYGDEPGVRRWRLDAQVSDFSQYKPYCCHPARRTISKWRCAQTARA